MNSTPDRLANLAQAQGFLREAVERGAEMVVFPENFTLMADSRETLLRHAETLRGPTVQALQSWAKEHGTWIVAGSVPIIHGPLPAKGPSKNQKFTNTCLVIAPNGKVVARYDKIHLFDADLPDRVYRESDNFRAGSKIVSTEALGRKLGLSVCYDLRFPELYRQLSRRGASIIMIPAAFTVPTGKAHWDILTRARAVENQAFVLAPGQWGFPFPGRETYGNTRIIDPWGRVIAEKISGTGIVLADLDFRELDQVRTKLPALRHRRLRQS